MKGSGKGAIFAKLFSKIGKSKMMTHFTKFKRQRHHRGRQHRGRQHHDQEQYDQYQYLKFEQFLTHHEKTNNKVVDYTLENIPHTGIFDQHFLGEFLNHISNECKKNLSNKECIYITNFFNEECKHTPNEPECTQNKQIN